MDAIQSEYKKPKARSKSLESQLEQIRQREAAIVSKRQELEAKVAKKQRSMQTKAFVCMGALIEKLMREDNTLRKIILEAAAKENIQLRRSLGGYWPELMPSEEEINNARTKGKRNANKSEKADSATGKKA